MLRFYKGAVTWESVWQMTMRQFCGMLDLIEPVAKLETGNEKSGAISDPDAIRQYAQMDRNIITVKKKKDG